MGGGFRATSLYARFGRDVRSATHDQSSSDVAIASFRLVNRRVERRVTADMAATTMANEIEIKLKRIGPKLPGSE